MLAKDAFNETCNMICRKYEQYGFKYIKSKKVISAIINGCTIKLCANTSRDNSSDFFVAFNMVAMLVCGDKTIFYLRSQQIKESELHGENICIEMPESSLIHSMPTRQFVCGILINWNIAFAEQRELAVDDVTEWLDRSFFANEQVIESLGVKIVSA